MMGALLSSGSRKFETVGYIGTGESAQRSARKFEQTPLRARPWLVYFTTSTMKWTLLGCAFRLEAMEYSRGCNFGRSATNSCGGKFYGRMFDEKIDYIHAPKIGIEILFPIRLEQVIQERSG